MVDKKIKYVLSDFMLDGGAKGSKRSRGKGKSAKPGKYRYFDWSKGTSTPKYTSRSFGEPPENEDPNDMANYFEQGEYLEFENRLEGYKIEVVDWGNSNYERSRPGATNNNVPSTHLSKLEILSKHRK